MEIEFLDPEEGPPAPLAAVETIGPDEPERLPRLVFARWVVAPLLLFAGAAALAVVAGFRTVYAVDRSHAGGASYAVDGWGRYHLADRSPVPSGFHEARYGLALACCAGVLAIAAIVLAATCVRHVRLRLPDRVVTVLAVATGCVAAVLVGLTAAMALQFDSVVDINRVSFVADSSQILGAHPPQVGLGAAFWLTLASVVAAILGSLGSFRARREWRAVVPG